jgi:hypothetical protein
MIIGFFPEILSDRLLPSALQGVTPAMAFVAFLLGYLCSEHLDSAKFAKWTWVLGFTWLIYGMHDFMREWSPTWSDAKTAWTYALTQLFGPDRLCSGSECLGRFLFAAPFVTSVMYSIGAFLKQYRDAQTLLKTDKCR